jgi:hexosaminidase
LDAIIKRFTRKITNLCGRVADKPTGGVSLILNCSAMVDIPHLDMDESYSLKVAPGDANVIDIQAKTNVGIMRALETLLQLFQKRNYYCELPAVTIEDSPKFKWRGLQIDVARHFHNLDALKANIEAMAMVKLNVLHLHLSDDQGFRFESKTHPLLQECGGDGRAGKGLYFRQTELKELVQYAAERGVRVIPEIDVPGHIGSWCGYPKLDASGKMGEAPVREYGVFHHSLDVTKDEVYEFLKDLFKEVAQVFPDKYVHLGGDEVTGNAWTYNPNILKFMNDHKMQNDWHKLQGYFFSKMDEVIRGMDKIMYGWQESITPLLPKQLIQAWMGTETDWLISAGRPQIYSRGLYLDWTKYPIDYYNEEIPSHQSVLGGEACMWSEYVETETLASRVWPSAAGLAEKFWSSDKTNGHQLYWRVDHLLQLFDDTQIGLNVISYMEPMVKRLAGSYHVPLLVLASVMKNNNRVQTPGYHTLKPLTDLVDVVSPDPITVRKFARLVDVMATEENFLKYKGVARQILTDWRDNHDKLKPLLTQTPQPEGQSISGAIDLSAQLSTLAQCGLQTIAKREGNASATIGDCRIECPVVGFSRLDICAAISQLRAQSV